MRREQATTNEEHNKGVKIGLGQGKKKSSNMGKDI